LAPGRRLCRQNAFVITVDDQLGTSLLGMLCENPRSRCQRSNHLTTDTVKKDRLWSLDIAARNSIAVTDVGSPQSSANVALIQSKLLRRISRPGFIIVEERLGGEEGRANGL
jgi:hypothetical protein